MTLSKSDVMLDRLLRLRKRILQCWPHCSRVVALMLSLADRTNGRAYATVLRPSIVCTLCIVAKRRILEQKLLLRAYRKSYVKNRLVTK